MKMTRFLVIAIIGTLYGIMNYYVGKRLWELMPSRMLAEHSVIFWVLFWVIAFSFLTARIAGSRLPSRLASGLFVVGSYWLAAGFYLFLLFGLQDTICVVASSAGLYIPSQVKAELTSSVAISLTLAIVGYGVWNAHNPRISQYKITINKNTNLEKLRIVMVSDIHLGTIVGPKRLSQLITEVNKLNPDLVLLPGDIMDDHPGSWSERQIIQALSKLESRYGKYAVLGNHEYFGGRVDKNIALLERSGIRVLRDSFVLVDNSFYLAGRDEKLARMIWGQARLPLTQVLSGIDRSLPVILMDHQPVDLDEALREGVDLQLSGHTHVGQIFPNRLVTRKIYEIDWGYLRKGSLQVIVSSGFGTWGPPIRIGNYPEIVVINLEFAHPSRNRVTPFSVTR